MFSSSSGQAPSDHPGFAELLAEAGIDSISLNPDSVCGVRQRLFKHEALIEERKKAEESQPNTKHLGAMPSDETSAIEASPPLTQ
mmetsp:Transcript_32375/g.65651  ORF Transcript_32375/g.65651 Transcript_32375/m.65651 type:complete len:85 (+) Transcript_32375:11-265(+)